jgi:hypothetical protein
MPQRTFANQKALIDYAERNGLAYLWDGTRAFYRRQRLLSPNQYQTAEVRTYRGVRRVMLLRKAILEAEWAAVRDTIAIKRERWRAKRAEKEKRTAARAALKQPPTRVRE